MKIAITGSLAYDRIMNFPGFFKDHILLDKIHTLNVSFCTSTLRECFGGTAGNIAYNLKLLGEEPLIISQAGSDFSKYQKWLSNNKITAAGIKIYPNDYTAGAYIITDQNDNQITGFYPGAMRQPASFPAKIFSKVKYLIIAPGHKEDMMTAVSLAKKQRIAYFFDFGQQITALSPAELKHGIFGATVVIANDYEIDLMLSKTRMTKKNILDKIYLLVTTLGPKGSIFETSDRKIKIPIAQPKNTCDPTGAGDAYRAGLLKGLLADYPLEKVGRLAALVSVYTVENYGTQTHSFNWLSLARRYYKNFKEKL